MGTHLPVANRKPPSRAIQLGTFISREDIVRHHCPGSERERLLLAKTAWYVWPSKMQFICRNLLQISSSFGYSDFHLQFRCGFIGRRSALLSPDRW
jgi:hypothetical protein